MRRAKPYIEGFHDPEEKEPMGLARFKITPELFRQFLDLPPDTRIISVLFGEDSSGENDRDITVVVSSPDFPERPAGEPLPDACPQYTSHTREVTQFQGWGL